MLPACAYLFPKDSLIFVLLYSLKKKKGQVDGTYLSSFCFFVPHPPKAQNAQQLHERIQSSSMDAKLEALKDLASLSRDVTFAQEFINLDGISLLTQMVESGTE